MWKKEYKNSEYYWGTVPSKLVRNANNISNKGLALDIGCGEGRNSIYLASLGFNVLSIDKERAAIDKFSRYLAGSKHKEVITAKVADIKRVVLKDNSYDLIISIHAIDFLKHSEIEKVLVKLKKATKPNGKIFMSVFSIEDPAFHRITKIFKKKSVENNTFYMPKLKSFRHFFSKDELINFFTEWDIEILQNKLITDNHGKIGKHVHAVLEIIAKKKND